MPKRGEVVSCDCGGTLQECGSTTSHTGRQWGDATHQTIFFHCDKCSQVFMEHLGSGDSYFVEYQGSLTPAELEEHADKISGCCYDGDDEDLLAHARPLDWRGKEEVEKVDGQTVVEVPEALLGKTILMRVATPEEEIKAVTIEDLVAIWHLNKFHGKK